MYSVCSQSQLKCATDWITQSKTSDVRKKFMTKAMLLQCLWKGTYMYLVDFIDIDFMYRYIVHAR